MAQAQHRAVFDARVGFSNGGGLSVEGFRVDVPSPDTGADEVAALFVASLGLLMTEAVVFERLSIVEEQHKGTRGGPGDPSARSCAAGAGPRRVELSHIVEHGEGAESQIDRIAVVGDAGTCLDSPFHRHHDGAGLSAIPLDRLVDLPAVVVRTAGSGARAVDVGHLAPFEVEGRAVLLHTGGDERWGTPASAVEAPYLTARAAAWLVQRKAALVGVDSAGVDPLDQGRTRPAHSTLLAAGIPLVLRLTGLDQLPPLGVRGFGTFAVRAFATLPG